MAVFNKLGSNLASRSIGPRLQKLDRRLQLFLSHLLFIEPREIGDIHQRCDVQGKLEKHRRKDIRIEDISERPFL